MTELRSINDKVVGIKKYKTQINIQKREFQMISVLMAIYNEKIEWIRESITSILGQSYRNIEFIIVVDNPCLSSSIKSMLFDFESTDERIKIIWNESNLGIAKSMNKAFTYAKGEYIARMDADDISMPNRLEIEWQYLLANDLDMVSANKINIDEDGKEISVDPTIDRDPEKSLKYSNIIVHPLVLLRSTVFERMNGYRTLTNSEDYDLWLRMIDKGYRIGIVNQYLLKYRIRGNGISVERRLEQYYVDKYVVMLAEERKRKGIDSFSVAHHAEYIKSRDFSERKKLLFEKANLLLTDAYEKKNKKDKKYILLLCKLFVNFPHFTIERMLRYVHSYKDR